MRSFVFFGLIIGLALAMFHLLQPFFYTIFWASIIAVMFYPLYRWINAYVKLPAASSFISVILVMVMIFLPLSLIGIIVYYQSVELYTTVSQGLFRINLEQLAQMLQGTPWADSLMRAQENWSSYAVEATRALTGFLFQNIRQMTQNLAVFIAQTILMLYTLFYFFKDGKNILHRIMHASPLGDNMEVLLFERFTSTARATLKGSLIVGGVQGLLGGILFWLTGVQSAFIWGILMMIFSLVPGIGAFVIWLPAGLIMLITGNVWQGITILAVGAFVISIIDNILRPPLVGKDIQMHPLVVLFSTLGGILLFGISGFIIGPIIAALFLSVMSIYEDYYKKELSNN